MIYFEIIEKKILEFFAFVAHKFTAFLNIRIQHVFTQNSKKKNFNIFDILYFTRDEKEAVCSFSNFVIKLPPIIKIALL